MASQSSTTNDGMSSLANDGLLATDYSSCAHTKNETSPWWSADLGSSRHVDRVELWTSSGARPSPTRVPLSTLLYGGKRY